MITDKALLFSDDQDVNTATVVSTNVYDTGPLASGNAGIDIGLGEPMYLFIRVTEAFAGAGSVTVDLDTDSTADLATSATTHWSMSLTATNGTLNAIFVAALPPTTDYERYIGINYTKVSTVTAGQVTAGLVRDIAQIKQHASGLNWD